MRDRGPQGRFVTERPNIAVRLSTASRLGRLRDTARSCSEDKSKPMIYTIRRRKQMKQSTPAPAQCRTLPCCTSSTQLNPRGKSGRVMGRRSGPGPVIAVHGDVVRDVEESRRDKRRNGSQCVSVSECLDEEWCEIDFT